MIRYKHKTKLLRICVSLENLQYLLRVAGLCVRVKCSGDFPFTWVTRKWQLTGIVTGFVTWKWWLTRIVTGPVSWSVSKTPVSWHLSFHPGRNRTNLCSCPLTLRSVTASMLTPTHHAWWHSLLQSGHRCLDGQGVPLLIFSAISLVLLHDRNSAH